MSGTKRLLSQSSLKALSDRKAALQTASSLSDPINRVRQGTKASRSTASARSKASPRPGQALTSALGKPPSFLDQQQVRAGDTANFYRFTVKESGVFNAKLTGLSSAADLRLIQDKDNNDKVDQGEILALQWEEGTKSESIRKFLNPGTYHVQVRSNSNQAVDYSLSTAFTPAATDSRQFSIQINYQSGLESLNEAGREAIRKAANFWEKTIAHSTFDTVHNLVIDLWGTKRNDNILAYAAPTTKQPLVPIQNPDGSGDKRQLPIAGYTVVNTRFLEEYNQDPLALRDIVTHEFGHVLGLGTLWETPEFNLVDRLTGTYLANTHAGTVYGELLETFVPTPVPLETQYYGHWNETVFDEELMTPFAESKDVLTPLSKLSIASLRDIGWAVNYGAAQTYIPPSKRIPDVAPAPALQPATSGRSGPGGAALQLRCGCGTCMMTSRPKTVNSKGSKRNAKAKRTIGAPTLESLLKS